MFAVIFICIRIILVSWDDWEIKKQRLCKISGAKKVYCGRCAKGECDVFAVFASFSHPSRLPPSLVVAPVTLRYYHVLNIFPPFWRSPPQMFALSMREGGCVHATQRREYSSLFLAFIYLSVSIFYMEGMITCKYICTRKGIWKTGEMTRKVQCRLNNE